MDREDVSRIALNGDLSMVGVTGQYPLLAQYLAGSPADIATASDHHAPFEIDLTGVDALDACGCQLLVAFVHNLKKRGAGACSFKMTVACRDIIHSLGFDDEFYPGCCA